MNRQYGILATLAVAGALGGSAETFGADPSSGRRHIVTIQVTDYAKDGPFAQLRPAKRDSKGIAEAFGTGDGRGIHIHIGDTPVKGVAGPKPTAAEIRKALDELARDDRIGPDDEVIVHFSGIGFESPTGPAICPSGASLKDPDSMILVQELVLRVRLIPAGRKLLVIDSCRNSLEVTVKMQAPEAPKSNSVTRPKGLKKPTAFILIQAASEGQYAYNCPNSDYGILTCQLIAALKESKPSAEGEITISAMADFLRRTVPKSSRELFQAEQVPLVTDESSAVWVLAIVQKPAADPGNAGKANGSIASTPPPAQNPPGWYTPPQQPPSQPQPQYNQRQPVQDRPVMRQAANQAIRYGLSRIR